MSKICPKCGKELADDALVCDLCGYAFDEEEEKTVPTPDEEENKTVLITEPVKEDEDADEIEPAAEPAEAEEDEEKTVLAAEPAEGEETEPAFEPLELGEDENAAEAESAETGSDEAGTDAMTPGFTLGAASKKKPVGLWIAFITLVVLLIAAAVAIVMLLLPKGGDAKAAFDKMADASLTRDYDYYFNHDYYTKFISGDVDGSIKQAKETEKESGAATEDMSDKYEITVLEVIPLSESSKESLKSQYKTYQAKDTDKIEDIQLVVSETLYKEENMVYISNSYAVKVSGEWYILSGS